MNIWYLCIYKDNLLLLLATYYVPTKLVTLGFFITYLQSCQTWSWALQMYPSVWEVRLTGLHWIHQPQWSHQSLGIGFWGAHHGGRCCCLWTEGSWPSLKKGPSSVWGPSSRKWPSSVWGLSGHSMEAPCTDSWGLSVSLYTVSALMYGGAPSTDPPYWCKTCLHWHWRDWGIYSLQQVSVSLPWYTNLYSWLYLCWGG